MGGMSNAKFRELFLDDFPPFKCSKIQVINYGVVTFSFRDVIQLGKNNLLVYYENVNEKNYVGHNKNENVFI